MNLGRGGGRDGACDRVVGLQVERSAAGGQPHSVGYHLQCAPTPIHSLAPIWPVTGPDHCSLCHTHEWREG